MNSVKLRSQVNAIFTLRDAEAERQRNDYEMERRAKIRELRRKIRHWETQVRKFNGEIHRETLARFQKELDSLL